MSLCIHLKGVPVVHMLCGNIRNVVWTQTAVLGCWTVLPVVQFPTFSEVRNNQRELTQASTSPFNAPLRLDARILGSYSLNLVEVGQMFGPPG